MIFLPGETVYIFGDDNETILKGKLSKGVSQKIMLWIKVKGHYDDYWRRPEYVAKSKLELKVKERLGLL